MKSIFALLVGIDKYPAPTPKLDGTLKDIGKVKTFLETNFNDRPLHIKTLTEGDATRKNFIDAFRNHLGQAKENDVIWFHFSGHGSRQLSSPEFQKINSGKKDETLVLFDSRPNGNDLADKELAVLIAEVSKNNPHIVITLDCCHSGSGTRSATVESSKFKKRLSNERSEIRPLDSYLEGYYTKHGLKIPQSSHIVYAACNRFQSAKESFEGGGIFTQNLIEVLTKNKNISYNDLLVRMREGVVNMKWEQDPQIESYGDTSINGLFLDGRELSKNELFGLSHSEDGWNIDAGEILGLAEGTNVAILPEGANEILFVTQIDKSSGQKSFIKSNEKLQNNLRYWVKPLEVKDFSLQVALKVSDDVKKIVQEVITNYPAIQLVITPTGNEQYTLQSNGTKTELFDKERNQVILFVTDNTFIPHLFVQLNQIAKWHRIFNLQNSKSKINNTTTSKIELEITNEPSLKFLPGNIDLKYQGQPFLYKLWIQNTFTQNLNYALFYLSDNYGIKIIKNDPLEKSETPTLFLGGTDEHCFLLPDGQMKSIDTFFLIVSTERTDDFRLDEEDLVFGEIKKSDRLIPGLTKKIKGDWYTQRFTVKLTR